jgi:4'-phosphopantetheinyl transferase EntD
LVDDAPLLAWLRSRLPPHAGAAVCEVPLLDQIAGRSSLMGDEWRLIAAARAPRRAEFRAGRVAARRALSLMGVRPTALMARAGGDPEWPQGVVGSISHSGKWAAAVAARREDARGLGLDLESAEPLERDLVHLVCRPEEREPDSRLAERGIDSAKLRFVTKEAWYKAIYPEWGRFVDFQEAVVEFDPSRAEFKVRFVGETQSGRAPPSAGGTYIRASELLCAVCVITAAEGS